MKVKMPGSPLWRIAFCMFMFICLRSAGQEDSLKNVLFSNLPDTTRSQAALKLCMLYSSNDPDSCLLIAEKGIAITKNKNCEKYLPSLLKLKGVAFVNKGEYKQSAEEYFKALEVAEKQGNSKEIAAIYNNLGVNFWYQKDYKNALKYHTEALKQRKKLNIPKEIAKSYNNLGTVEVDMGNYKDAVEHYMMALKIKDSIGDVLGIANGNNNLGIVYERMNRLDDANTAYKKALKIFKQEGDKRGEVVSLNNIAVIYKNQEKYNDAFQLGKEALAIGKELNDQEDLKMSYEVLAASSFHLGKYKDAYEYLENYVKINDSLTSSNNFKTVQELEKKYNTEKQQQEILLLQQSNLIQEVELSRAETQKKSLLVIILLALVVIGLAVFAFIKISRQKKDLEENKSNIEVQNSQLELQKKEILDSINYAKRIQDAMLKDEEHTSMHLPPHFILFKPKDIVSGDFYWALEKENFLYFAAADCTGHGVPGAFLTLLGTSFLNEINATEKIFTPAQILDQLRDKIVKELSSNQEKTRDGMDISLIRVDLKNLEAVWAGAYNPLWISKESDPGNFIEIQADKQSVGYSEELKNFTDHSFKLNSGDQIYLFTDGFADQFGGQSGKKFKYKQLKNLLADLRNKPIDDQKKELNASFENWRGKLEQVDDVLIVGMKF